MRALLARRSIAWLTVFLSGLLVMSSCVSMDLESDFNEDGGATHTMALTIDMGDLGQLGDLGEGEIEPFEDFDEIEREASEEGFRVERIEEGDIVGVRLIREVDDSSDLGEQLNAMLNAGSTEGEDVSPFSGDFENDGDDFSLTLTVDGAQLTDSAGEGLDDTEDLGIGLDAIFEFTYTARLPGEIDEEATNGQISEDGTVTWDLPLDSTETLTAASSTGGGGSDLTTILVVAGIIVLGLIALAAVIFFILMNRRGAAPAASTPEGEAAPPPPGAYDPDQPTRPIVPPAEEPANVDNESPDEREDDNKPL